MARAQWILLLMIPSCTLGPFALGQAPDPGPENLVAWKLAHFSEDELADGTSDDINSVLDDGISNLLRYALGSGPRDPLPAIIAVRPRDRTLEITYPNGPARADVKCQLEGSRDLRSWTQVEPDPTPESTEPGSTRVLFADFSTESAHQFFRLRAERLIEDMDGDGLTDDQELGWFASVDHNQSDDPDRDGLSTEEELALGRSPHRGVLIDPILARQTVGLEIFTPLE